jgi:uncharacterized protein YceK
MKTAFYRFLIAFLTLLLTSCGTIISQSLSQDRDYLFNCEWPLSHIYSGVIWDVRGAFHYGCVFPDQECKYNSYKDSNMVEGLLILDIPLSFILDTVFLPITVYRQNRYGDMCRFRPQSPIEGEHLVSIAVTPTDQSIAREATLQLTAIGTYSNGITMDISAYVTWSSSDTSKVAISSSGLASAVEVGLVQISARSGDISGTSALRIDK